MASFFIHPTASFNTVTFEFYETDYSDFLTQVRNQLASSVKTCEIQTTPSNPAIGNVFKDIKATEAKELFPNAATTVTFSFSSSYSDLERPSISGTNRATIELTFESLYGDVEAIAGQKSVQNKVVAKFFLRATQFVSEAARFKFIETAIENQAITPEFRNKMISYENAWDNISQEIHTAASETNCGRFEKPITVNGHKLEYVKDVKGDMSLIKYKTKKKAANSSTL
ncbi:ribosome-inactivating protein PD-L1/PD-L2-like [Chenopodium quinoa]|uniref:ribosome-inactivating protein PD-L1/PD-L2-like n=1 Tax=Chenopodium quinoa TaxID=63459 RepID=UPI000B78499B|nr:ribosome-inactivating protein PD-L1/PD-L2-like [Chenopodium quinoa]